MLIVKFALTEILLAMRVRAGDLEAGLGYAAIINATYRLKDALGPFGMHIDNSEWLAMFRDVASAHSSGWPLRCNSHR